MACARPQLPSQPLNTFELERGHPIAVLPRPRPSQPGCGGASRGGGKKESALLLWRERAQVWAVAGGAIEMLADVEIPQCTCATPLEWPGGGAGGAEGSSLLWLIGTGADTIHVLRADDLKPAAAGGAKGIASGGAGFAYRLLPAKSNPSPALVSRQPSEADGAAAGGSARLPSPIGISSLAVMGPIDPKTANKSDFDAGRDATLPEHSALCVGFCDGSLRQYALASFIGG